MMRHVRSSLTQGEGDDRVMRVHLELGVNWLQYWVIAEFSSSFVFDGTKIVRS